MTTTIEHTGCYVDIDSMVYNIKYILTHSTTPNVGLCGYCFNVIFPSSLDEDTKHKTQQLINSILFIHELMTHINNGVEHNETTIFLNNEYNRLDVYLTELIQRLWMLQ